jgi:hypothetical protein
MKNTRFSARVQTGYNSRSFFSSFNYRSLFSSTSETSSVGVRDTASTAIHVFGIVENAADDLVGTLAFTFFLAIAVLLLYVWSIPDRTTSVTVTAFVGLMIIVIIYNNKRYIVLPRSVIPIPPATLNVSVTSVKGKLPGVQVVNSQLITVDFFSNIAKPALHHIDRDVVKTARTLERESNLEANVSVELGGVDMSVGATKRTTVQRSSLEHGTFDNAALESGART